MNFKLLFLVSFVMYLPMSGMDKPVPCDHIRTPKGERVRLNIYNLAHDSIQGHDEESDQENLPPALLEASPLSYCKGLRSLHEKRFERSLAKKGITPEMVKDRDLDAVEFIQEENEKIPTEPLESPLKRECRAVARVMGVTTPEFKKARLDNPAECRGDLVLIDSDFLCHEAPTPGRRASIVAHELRHRANGEYRRNIALHMACDVAGVTLSPKFLRKRSRCDEFFADLEMAAHNRIWAQSSRTLTRQNRQAFGDGVPSTHPTFRQREIESELCCDLHEVHAQEKSSNRSTKRALLREFEALEQQKTDSPDKSELKKEFESAWGD
jgi:hypothetical protein